MIMPAQSAQVIYLDTNGWIGLARGYYGRTSALQRVAQNVVEASKSGQAIFPLSITNFSETVRNLNRDRRKRLADYMVLVSQGWAILPAPIIVAPEIKNACLRYLALPPKYDLGKFVIKKGISQLVGARGTLAYKKSNKPLPQQLEKEIMQKIESPETLLLLMELGVTQSFVKKDLQGLAATARKLEQIRSEESRRIRDNDTRRRAASAKYLITEVNPEVIRFLLSIGVDPKTFANEVLTDQKAVIRFFQSMPTSYCEVQLTLYRDMMGQRRIQPNDLHDIMSLSIAIPYSDVVVTERMWQSAIRQTKLDKLYHTTVLKSVTELEPVLEPN
jgi:hypothetical protein